MAKMNLAIALFEADNVLKPYNLILNPTQYNQLFTLVTGTASFEFDVIQRRIGGQVFESPRVTVDTGMLLATGGRGFFDLFIGQDMTYETEELEKTKNLWGITYECLVPRIKAPNAICQLTNI